MGKLFVVGNQALKGDIKVAGSKNAALPIIFATILTRGVSKIHNLPKISDVTVALDIISELGAVISCEGECTYINTENMRYTTPSDKSVGRLRGSTYLMGACLGRFGKCVIQAFGGCNFAERPIDLHLACFEKMGGEICDNIILLEKGNGAEIRLSKVSVGATVNAILLASSIKEQTKVYNYAKEPHIYALIDYLDSAGATIYESDGALVIYGADLRGGEVRIPADMLEAGTFLTLSMMHGCKIDVLGFEPHELDSFFEVMRKSGAEFEVNNDSARVVSPPTKEIYLKTAPYPDFPTDLQPIVAPLMASIHGGTIEETVWHGRFGYLSQLGLFGVGYRIVGDVAKIEPSAFVGASVICPDLRGGMACLIAALSTPHVSTIENCELIFRGYENIVERLRTLGADISYEV